MRRSKTLGPGLVLIAVLTACSSPTEINPAIESPDIRSGEQIAEVITGSPADLQWAAVDGAARYAVEIRRIDSHGSFVEDRFTEEETLEVVFTVAGTYRWRVRGIDGSGEVGPWSRMVEIRVVGAGPRFVN